MVGDDVYSDKHWSMSLGTLQRLDTQLRRINSIKMDYENIDLKLYAIALSILYDEVHPFLKKKAEKETAATLMAAVGKKYSEFKISALRKKGERELYAACNFLNLFLREMMYEYDLLMNKPDTDWENRL